MRLNLQVLMRIDSLSKVLRVNLGVEVDHGLVSVPSYPFCPLLLILQRLEDKWLCDERRCVFTRGQRATKSLCIVEPSVRLLYFRGQSAVCPLA